MGRIPDGSDQLSADCGGNLLLCRCPGKCAGRADAEGSGAGRSDDEEVQRVPERDSHRCKAMRALCAAADGQSRLDFPERHGLMVKPWRFSFMRETADSSLARRAASSKLQTP